MNGHDTMSYGAPAEENFGKDRPSKAALIKRFLTPIANVAESSQQGVAAPKKYPAVYTQFDQFEGYKQQKMLRDAAKLLGAANPFFGLHDGTAGATTAIDGKVCINFSSYDYLGLSSDPRVQQAAKAAIETYGTSVSASRIVSGERPIHRELERALAETYQVDDALIFVSGHATNVAVIGHLFGPKDLIVHDALIHNSALVGAQLSGATRRSIPHNDTEALERLLIEQRDHFERVLIVVEGIYSMDGDAPDLPELVRIKNRYGALLMVDEAHSFGVLGANGLGLREHANVPALAVDIWMGTLSKALAGCGGYIAGSHALIEQLRYSAPGFVYSVGMAPAVAAASLAALKILRAEPERVNALHDNGRYFLNQARAHNLNTGLSMGYSVVPVVIGNSLKAVKMSQSLLEQGINAQPIIHPAVEERAARIRFFIGCHHQAEHINQAIAKLELLK